MPWVKAPDAFRRAEASWRRMLATQPPVHTILITKTNHSFMCTSERHEVLKDSPLRMGALYDLAVSFLDADDTSFRIFWRMDTEDKDEGDIMLEVVAELGCLSALEKWILDERFCSDEAKPVEITWGKWD
ncbi:hypothetical protein K438DRAFT_1960111 [Mycena galopus ATCC 62051]|nr:hypothetical protein K438DRAFT_1960111 [Mycena galopus ATCC 62051]